MHISFTNEEITQAFAELIQEGKINIGIDIPNVRKQPKAANKNKTKNKPEWTYRSDPIKKLRGVGSIVEGLNVGESRTLFGHSKRKVYSALVYRAKTHACEKYACVPVHGAFMITRIK